MEDLFKAFGVLVVMSPMFYGAWVLLTQGMAIP
jgi:hypothetical protein